MQVTITSAGIQALCAVLVLLSAAAGFAVNAIVARQIKKMNGTYIYAAGSRITGHEIERRLDEVETEIDGLHRRIPRPSKG